MEEMTRLFTGVALIGAVGASSVWADTPGVDWKVSKDQAEVTLKGAGYTQITKIEADDGHWEGEDEFQIDPHDGKIIKDELDN
ncbi:PepSY domain-containing protein [Pseudomonas putida]|uniref:PepSY domain-containing protein n=1 Tax=Pseudomonas putida TaxID=303 RepID=UPI0015753F75|nr:PepSY domain-containing protein [Pseudomonas putida]NTY90430.1 PepSY domain-containing protein [Pseudomonas putida]NTY98972.1 PepSY domain-containing protein [Pseudomonas putida]NTZ21255.1 PepSY domain-containing protein [Pseudomonas putida]NTZ53226.1 PepSY domain-containing protein [Pseudomonas putida]NTZ65124.1 PepSY domain-containing protein [Pseudomonas putida]